MFAVGSRKLLIPGTAVFLSDRLLGLKKEAGEAKVNLESWVTFEFLDSRADADHSLELARKVIGEGAKAILGIVSSEVALALKDYGISAITSVSPKCQYLDVSTLVKNAG